MLKRMTAKILVFAFICSMGIPSFALAANIANAEESTFKTKDGTEKSVTIISNDIKLITLENESSMTFEQYDSKDNLIDRVVINKNTETATSSFEETMGSSEFVLDNMEFADSIRATYLGGYNIDTVKVYNPLTSPVTEKKMLIFENYEKPRTVTYTIPSTLRTIAQLAAGFSIGLGVSSAIAGKIAQAAIAAGVCLVTGNTIDKILSITVAADKTLYSYYGKDFVTSKASSPYQSGAIYKVTDTQSKYLNNTYTEGFLYNNGGKYQIVNAVCKNLYGVNFKYT